MARAPTSRWITTNTSPFPARRWPRSNGQYDIRVTEELSEVSYLDQIQLFAVDHPAGTEIFTNEKFKGPPYPEFRLFGVTRRIYPTSARDDAGPRRPAAAAAARPEVSRSIPAPRTRRREAAHAGTRFRPGSAPNGHAVLLLNGWVDWPDGSTFRAASQEVQGRPGHAVPANAGRRGPMGDGQRRHGHARRQTQDHRGGTAVPLGQPQAAHRDQTLRLLGRDLPRAKPAAPASRISKRFRCSPPISISAASPKRASIRNANSPTRFSTIASRRPRSGIPPRPLHPLRRRARAARAMSTTGWCIMGSGDEMPLQLSTRSLPPPPAGWTRDFLLKVDGWAKDRDPNTAFRNQRGAAAVPRHEPLSLSGHRTFPE